MRRLVLLSLLLAGGAPVLAQNLLPQNQGQNSAQNPAPQQVRQPAQSTAQQMASSAATAAQVEALQQRLLVSQQTIATLERELEEAKSRTVALERCRTKNGHLVSIGRQLIEAYEVRYRQDRHSDPLQLARRRFEFELQSLTEAIYDNNVDVPIHVPDPKPSDPAPVATDASAAEPAAPAEGNNQ